MTGSEPSKNTPPAIDQIEVSLLGPGFGESIVLHLGCDEWMIVDSCLDCSSNGDIAPLQYLDEIGVNVADAVKLVVATHWHDDHIAGISEVLKCATKTRFAITSAFANADFKAALAPWLAEGKTRNNSGLDELLQLGPLMAAQTFKTELASANKILHERAGDLKCRVLALSPSDPAVIACIARLSGLHENEWAKRMPNISENHASVVLSVEVGDRRILLGSDLQVRSNRSFGWLAIVDDHVSRERQKFHVFKIPHHGSANGDHPEIWRELLEPNPIAITAPFVGGKTKLPTLEDKVRILSNTPHAYLTAPASGKGERIFPRAAERVMQARARTFEFIPKGFGHIRVRGARNTAVSDWSIECFGRAAKMTASN